MKTIIYSRVSSLGDRQNTESQIAELTQIAKNRGWEIVKVFSEKISGAKSNKDRDVLTECFQFAKSNQIDMILFAELSRLGRSIAEVQKSINWFGDNKINAYFKNTDITLLNEKREITPYMRIIMDCLALSAEIERENIAYRLNRGRELAISKGVPMGRKKGSKETQSDKKEKYPITISLIQKGYSNSDILTIANSRTEKVSLSTIKRLKKEFK